LKQVDARLSGQTIESVLVVFLDIRSAAVAKTIIDIKVYESAFDHFVAQVWEVHKTIAEKRAPADDAAATPPTDFLNPELHQNDATHDFDSDNDVIVDIPVMNDNEDESLAMEHENCTLWINQPVDRTRFLNNTSSKTKNVNLKKELQTIHGRFLRVDPLK
jgi:hypothetical protein